MPDSNYADERAPGGRLNPINASEDMLKRAIDHLQLRTDQSVTRAVSELRQATEAQWPLIQQHAQTAAENAAKSAAQQLDASAQKIADRMSQQVSIQLNDALNRADEMLTRHRQEAQKQVTRLILIFGAVALLVGACLIALSAAVK